MRLSRVILFILVITYVAQAAIYYFILPQTMAAHFDGTGRPDNWWSKEGFFIFDAAILLFLLLESVLVPRWVERLPVSMINLPNKKYWLAPERQQETFATIRNFLEWFWVLVLALLIVVNQLVFRANLHHEGLSAAGIWISLVLFIVAVVIWLAKFFNRFRTTN